MAPPRLPPRQKGQSSNRTQPRANRSYNERDRDEDGGEGGATVHKNKDNNWQTTSSSTTGQHEVASSGDGGGKNGNWQGKRNDVQASGRGPVEDEEGISTQDISELETDITTLIRNTGKSDGWPATFEKRIWDQERELIEKIRDGSLAAERAEASFDNGVLPFLAGCIARVGMKPEQPQRPFSIAHPSPEGQPLFIKSAGLVQASRSLINQYSTLADLQIDTSSRDTLLNVLNREEHDIAAAIKAGKRVAQAETMALLGLIDGSAIENARQGSDVLRVGFGEAQAQARLRGETVEGRNTEEWAAVAADSVKAFGKMSRAVDEDDMVN